jgi:hypothetical protein
MTGTNNKLREHKAKKMLPPTFIGGHKPLILYTKEFEEVAGPAHSTAIADAHQCYLAEQLARLIELKKEDCGV